MGRHIYLIGKALYRLSLYFLYEPASVYKGVPHMNIWILNRVNCIKLNFSYTRIAVSHFYSQKSYMLVVITMNANPNYYIVVRIFKFRWTKVSVLNAV